MTEESLQTKLQTNRAGSVAPGGTSQDCQRQNSEREHALSAAVHQAFNPS